MTHDEALVLIRRCLGSLLGGVLRCDDPTDYGRQWCAERPASALGSPVQWRYIWWRTDEDGLLTHCALFDYPPEGVIFFSPTAQEMCRFGEALASGWKNLDDGVEFDDDSTFGDPNYADICERVDWFCDDFRLLLQTVLTLHRTDQHKTLSGADFGGMATKVRPAHPELDRLEVMLYVNDWFSTEDADTIGMATQYILGVLPFEVFLDWIQQRHPEIAQQVEEAQRREAEDLALAANEEAAA